MVILIINGVYTLNLSFELPWHNFSPHVLRITEVTSYLCDLSIISHFQLVTFNTVWGRASKNQYFE